ncbi:MAG TPA: DNA helicase RecQ, partial [Prevotella sp.]
SFRENQEQAIQQVINGNDCFVLMPTGGGKSICYQIPALAMEGTAVVVSPLISLMHDQVQALKANGIAAEELNSINDVNQDTLIRRRCMSGDLKLIYVSPERLIAELPFLFSNIKISLFAIDEAHCIGQWGHDFRPEYSRLGILREHFPHTPIIALTATADRITREDIMKQLHLNTGEGSNCRIFISSFDRPNLSLTVKRGYKKQAKLTYIENFIKSHAEESGIIYCLSRKNAETVAMELAKIGIATAVYHAGLSNEERNRTQHLFKNDQVQVVCATIAFGMGIDKSNIRWVIHYNLPKSIESFYQEIGRAGRDGAPAETILFYDLADIVMLRKFALESGQQKVNMEKLDRMQQYAESSVCRRRILLNYFNEQTDHDCGNCDVCNHPPKRFNGTLIIQKALSAIFRAEERIGVNTAIEILRGMRSATVVRHRYDQMKTFGVGKDIPTDHWHDYFLQMLQMGFIEIAYNNHHYVKITESGRSVLFSKKEAELAVIEKPEKVVKPSRNAPKNKGRSIPEVRLSPLSVPTSAQQEDQALFNALRAYRMELAKEQELPAYMIFSDTVLHALATLKPCDVEHFGMVAGIGEFKKKKYGEGFTKIIRKH